jgi:hypothetical protein
MKLASSPLVSRCFSPKCHLHLSFVQSLRTTVQPRPARVEKFSAAQDPGSLH